MSTITVPSGTNTYVRTSYYRSALVPPKVGYFTSRVADTFVKVVVGGAIVQSDPLVSSDDTWLYMPEWIIGEAEASAQRDAGLGTVYNSVEDFLASLPD